MRFSKIVPVSFLVFCAAQASRAQSTAYPITPVLFVPTPSSFPVGYQPTSQQLDQDMADITEAMERLRTWYMQALGMDTYMNVRPAVRMDGWQGLSGYGLTWSNPPARYKDGIQIADSFWGTILSEVGNRGYGPGSSTSPKMMVIFCKGAGGFAGGAQWYSLHGGGMCVLGDWCLDSLAERVPSANWDWWTSKDKQTSAAGHEMGHTIGMPHPDSATNPVTGVADWNYTIMGYWWNWPTFATNPADPTWPLHGLHAWAANDGPSGQVFDYQDEFLLAYRQGWFIQPLPDADGDGVPDVRDQCPNTPAGVRVDANGCPIAVPGDLDYDNDVDQSDFGLLQVCLGLAPTGDCQQADLDHDGRMTAADVVVFRQCFTGANVAGSMNCAD